MTKPDSGHPLRLPPDLQHHAEQVLAGTGMTTEQATEIARTADTTREASPLAEALRAGWQACAAHPQSALPLDQHPTADHPGDQNQSEPHQCEEGTTR
jgi:hypothetical protein